MNKRSVVVSGHRTSVSLEPEFWAALARIAADRGMSINRLVSEIDGDRATNLASAIRIHVLKSLGG